MVNVLPVNDLREHIEDADCWCGPRVEWLDEDGMPFADGPLVVHNSADGRELFER